MVKNSATWLNLLFTGVIGYLVGYAVLMPRYVEYTNTMLLSSLVAIGLVYSLVRFAKSVRGQQLVARSDKRAVLIGLMCCFIPLHIFIAFALATDPSRAGWDPQSVYDAAKNFILTPDPYPDQTIYLMAYPNNLAIVGLLSGLFVITGTSAMLGIVAMLLLNVFVMNTALFFAVLIARRLAGALASILVLGGGFFFITLSLWTPALYSDTLGTIFPVLGIYLLLRLYDSTNRHGQLLLTTLTGIVAASGYFIKPTTIFVYMAAGLVALLAWLLRRQFSQTALLSVARIAIPGLAAFFIIMLVVPAGLSRLLMVTPQSVPITNYTLLGLSKVCTVTECRYGAWNMPDALKLLTFDDRAEYQKYTVDESLGRIASYGVGGYIEFLSQKGAWILGDGTFYAYKEGVVVTTPFYFNPPGASIVRTVLHPSGSLYRMFTVGLQALWMSILLLVIIGAVRRPARLDTRLVVRLSLLLLVLFLLFFEARSRYLYLYVPLVLVSAGVAFSDVVLNAQPSRQAVRSGGTRRSPASR